MDGHRVDPLREEDRGLHVPHDRCYDGAHHVWAQHDPQTGRVRVGIDAIGLESLGELAYVALQDVGCTIARGDTIGSLEAAKMTTTILAPAGGTIVARNPAVLADPTAVNRDPYGGGWLLELQPSDWPQDAAQLIGGGAIGAWAGAEIARRHAEEHG